MVAKLSPEQFFAGFSQTINLADLDFANAQKELFSFLSKAKNFMDVDNTFIQDVEGLLKEYFDAFWEDTIVVDAKALIQDYGDLDDVNVQDASYAVSDSVTLRYRGYYGPTGKDDTLKGFRHIISQLRKKSNDLTPLWKIIARDWFRSNKKEIFSQMGPGQRPDFEDLTLNTKLRKEKQSRRGLNQGIYPILVASGALMHSLTQMTDPDAIYEYSAKSVNLGSKHPVVKYHKEGRSGGNNPLPIRNPVRTGSPERLARWSRAARRYMTIINIRGVA